MVDPPVQNARGAARRRVLLDAVVADVLSAGLADFSLRRAARASDTTHKVLLYHFGSAERLLAEVVGELRARRVARAVAPAGATLADRVRALWPVLGGPEAEVLDQAMGLAMYDPDRYGALAAGSYEDYLPPLEALCPPGWTGRRRRQVAELVLAALRGLVLARRTAGPAFDPADGLAALARLLDREEAADLDDK